MAETGAGAAPVCSQCGSPLSGAFCSNCGAVATAAQPAPGPRALPEFVAALTAGFRAEAGPSVGGWKPAVAACLCVALIQGLAWWVLSAALAPALARHDQGVISFFTAQVTVVRGGAPLLILDGALFSLAVSAALGVALRLGTLARGAAAAAAVQGPPVLCTLVLAVLARIWAPLGGVFLLLPALLFAARLQRTLGIPEGLGWTTLAFYLAVSLVLGLGQLWWLAAFGLSV